MEFTLRPFVTAGVTLTAAGAVAVATVAPAPPAVQVSVPHVTAAAVQLTDAWSTLITDVAAALSTIAFAATSGSPNGNPIDPILQQVVTNLITYAGWLVGIGGNPGMILPQVQNHLTLLSGYLPLLGITVLGAVTDIVFAPVQAAFDTASYVGTNFLSDPLGTLFEAPAVFLDGWVEIVTGAISLTLLFRNLVAKAIGPGLPGPPAAATPNTTAKTVTLNATPPTGSSTPVMANTSGTKTAANLATTGTTGTTPGTTVPKGGATVSTTTQSGKLGTELNTAVKTVTTQLNAPVKKVSEVGKKR